MIVLSRKPSKYFVPILDLEPGGSLVLRHGPECGLVIVAFSHPQVMRANAETDAKANGWRA